MDAQNELPPSTKRNRLVFVLGVPFSGTTALGNFINNIHPGVYLGELERTPPFIAGYTGPTNLLECLHCGASEHPDECEWWGSAALEALERKRDIEIFRGLFERAQSSVIVEGSKSPNFLQSVAPTVMAEFDVRAVITTRNPILTMASYIKANEDVGNHVAPWFAANFWRDTYSHALSLVNSIQIPSLVYATEKLRNTDPREFWDTTRELRGFVGIGDETDAPQSAEAVQQLFEPTHQFCGNPLVQRKITNSRRKEIVAERYTELAQAFVQAPGAINVANLLGIDVMTILRGPETVSAAATEET